jgi:hypothetical protein
MIMDLLLITGIMLDGLAIATCFMVVIAIWLDEILRKIDPDWGKEGNENEFPF